MSPAKGEEKAEKKGDPVIAARFKAARIELGIPFQKDLVALIAEAAKRNGGRTATFDNTFISKLETGAAPGSEVKLHSAYAAALSLTRDEWADYIDGIITIEALREIRDARLRATAGEQTFRGLRNWSKLKAQARELDPSLNLADFEAIAGATVNGPPERVTPMRVATLAKVMHEIGGDK